MERARSLRVDAETKSARAVSFSAERATLVRSGFGGRRARGTRPAASRRRRRDWGDTYPRLWSPASVRFRVRRACACARAARVAARSSPRSRARKRGGDGLAEFEFESFRFAWRALLAARWKARSVLRAARGIRSDDAHRAGSLEKIQSNRHRSNHRVHGYFHAWKNRSNGKNPIARSTSFRPGPERTLLTCVAFSRHREEERDGNARTQSVTPRARRGGISGLRTLPPRLARDGGVRGTPRARALRGGRRASPRLATPRRVPRGVEARFPRARGRRVDETRLGAATSGGRPRDVDASRARGGVRVRRVRGPRLGRGRGAGGRVARGERGRRAKTRPTTHRRRFVRGERRRVGVVRQRRERLRRERRRSGRRERAAVDGGRRKHRRSPDRNRDVPAEAPRRGGGKLRQTSARRVRRRGSRLRRRRRGERFFLRVARELQRKKKRARGVESGVGGSQHSGRVRDPGPHRGTPRVARVSRRRERRLGQQSARGGVAVSRRRDVRRHRQDARPHLDRDATELPHRVALRDVLVRIGAGEDRGGEGVRDGERRRGGD